MSSEGIEPSTLGYPTSYSRQSKDMRPMSLPLDHEDFMINNSLHKIPHYLISGFTALKMDFLEPTTIQTALNAKRSNG